MNQRISLLLLSILLTCTATPLWAQKAKKEDVAKAIKEFEKFYANKNHHLRKAAVDGIGDTNSEKVVKHILSALSDKSDIVRAAVSPALAKQTTKEALALLTRELNASSKLDYKLAILDAFKETRPKVAYKTILKMAEGKVFELKLVAAELLALLPPEGSKSGDALMALTEDKQAQMRLVAIDGLIAIKHKDALDRVLILMDEDKDWRVKATAIAATVMFREKKCIQPLIKMLESGEGRLKEDAHHALVRLTGKQYSNNPVRWRKWWTKAQGRFVVPTEAELKKKEAELKAAMAAYESSEDSPPFLGIKTKSQRILFILDVSGSMQDLVIPTGTSKEKVEKFRELYGEGDTKIDLCRNQLINTIAGLKKHVKFNILLFDSEIRPWKKKLVSATAGKRNQAFKFLADLTPETIKDRLVRDDKGGTNTFAALNWAFGLKKGPQEKPSKNHTVAGDTVFLLTDGLPSVGRMIDVNELLRYFTVVNRRAKIVFHTLTFGTGNSGFLEPMATLSGGRFVSVNLE
jgi:HEAT repeat protein